VSAPPAPEKVAEGSGRAKGASATPYKAGDRVRVKWRGSKYLATIVAVAAPDRYLVHYEGYETAWDETVNADRIEPAR
jgi:hypothetical protein